MVASEIVLDSGPLGLVTNPRMSEQSIACLRWMQQSLAAGGRIIVPEIADLDGDVILAAQVLTSEFPQAVVATINIRHIGLFVPAAPWTDLVVK